MYSYDRRASTNRKGLADAHVLAPLQNLVKNTDRVLHETVHGLDAIPEQMDKEKTLEGVRDLLTEEIDHCQKKLKEIEHTLHELYTSWGEVA